MKGRDAPAQITPVIVDELRGEGRLADAGAPREEESAFALLVVEPFPDLFEDPVAAGEPEGAVGAQAALVVDLQLEKVGERVGLERKERGIEEERKRGREVPILEPLSYRTRH